MKIVNRVSVFGLVFAAVVFAPAASFAADADADAADMAAAASADQAADAAAAMDVEDSTARGGGGNMGGGEHGGGNVGRPAAPAPRPAPVEPVHNDPRPAPFQPVHNAPARPVDPRPIQIVRHDPVVIRGGADNWARWNHPDFARPVFNWNWNVLESVTCTAQDSYGNSFPVTENAYRGIEYQAEMNNIEDQALDFCYSNDQDSSCYLVGCSPNY